MYRVTLTRNCSETLKKLVKANLISEDELVVIRVWISEMVNLGPEYIEMCEYWKDHKLEGRRSGERSSAFSESGRIIYRIKKNKVEISVIKITPDHDYA